jgi:hypothetical protein
MEEDGCDDAEPRPIERTVNGAAADYCAGWRAEVDRLESEAALVGSAENSNP